MPKTDENHCGKRRLLAIFPRLPADPTKNSQILVLKNLAKHGWHSVVLTVVGAERGCDSIDPAALRFVRLTPHSWRWQSAQKLFRIRKTNRRGVVRRLASNALMPVTTVLSFPDAFAATRREIVDLALTLHEQSSFDVVLSLYNPLTAHLAARQVSSRTGIPWVALSKDFYSWPDHLLRSRFTRAVNRLKQWYEPATLRGSRALLTVSEHMNEHLKGILPDLQIGTMAHCFDETDLSSVQHPANTDGVFWLLWLGRLSTREGVDDHVKMRCLLQVLQEMQSEGLSTDRFRMRYVGSGGDVVDRMARESGCCSILDITPAVSHREAMSELSRATCLMYIQTPFGTRRRLAEYVGSRRPILAYPDYPGTYSSRLLRDYGAGRIAVDKDSLKAELWKLFRLHEAKGSLDLPVNDEVVHSQSASCRANEFATVLDRVVAKEPNRQGR